MKWHGRLFLALLCSLFLIEPATGATKVVASGLGFNITQDELDGAFRRIVLSRAVNGVDLPLAMEPFFKKQLLEELILAKVTSLRANPADRAQAYIQAKDNYTILREQFASATAFSLKIEGMGMSTNAYRLFLQEQALTQEVLKRELKPQTMVKEVEVLEFYNENLALWKTPEYAEVEHVLLAKVDLATGRRLNPDERAAKQATAAKVQAKAVAGVNFPQLAKEFSEDLATKNDGGKFRLYRSVADPKIAERVFSMRINVPELVESETGFHIIRVMKLESAGAKKIGEVRAEIREHLYQKKLNEKLPAYVKLLLEQARVKTFLD